MTRCNESEEEAFPVQRDTGVDTLSLRSPGETSPLSLLPR